MKFPKSHNHYNWWLVVGSTFSWHFKGMSGTVLPYLDPIKWVSGNIFLFQEVGHPNFDLYITMLPIFDIHFRGITQFWTHMDKHIFFGLLNRLKTHIPTAIFDIFTLVPVSQSMPRLRQVQKDIRSCLGLTPENTVLVPRFENMWSDGERDPNITSR